MQIVVESLMKRLLICLLWLALPAGAVIETYEFDNLELQQRYFDLSAELRCPKCQNQNIADSNAPIAADLRRQLHQQLHAGKSDDEIAEYMVSRYGEFVLYRPRWNAQTAVLWLAPILLLLGALLVLVGVLRKSPSRPGADTESADDAERLRALLNESERLTRDD